MTCQQKQLTTLITTLVTVITIMAKTITVSDNTHDALAELGKKSETYDEIIIRLMKGFKNE